MKQKQRELKEETYKLIIVIWHFNIPLSITDRTRQSSKDKDLNNKSTNLTWMIFIEHFTQEKEDYTFFSNEQMIYQDRLYPGP